VTSLWRTAKLRSFCEFRHGGTPSKSHAEFWGGNIPWVSPKDMRTDVIQDTEDHITRKAVDEDGAVLTPPGSLLVVVRSGILVRSFPVARTVVEASFNQDMKAIRVNHRVASPTFVFRFLQAREQEILTQGVKRGATVHSIHSGFLESLEIPLPTPREQWRIVELLEQADVLCRHRAEADAFAARIRPALFRKMFGDTQQNKKGCTIVPLKDAGAEVRYGLGQPPKSSCDGLPLLRATNIHYGRIFEKSLLRVRAEDVPKNRRAFLSADDVLVVRSGAYTGDVAQVTEKWAGSVAGYDLVVSPGPSLVGEFVESLLLTPAIQKGYFANIKARAGQPHLNAEQVELVPTPKVPKDLQKSFAQKVCQIRASYELQDVTAKALNALFQTMLHRAFIGELTALWREAHMKELLAEMEQQARYLNSNGATS
jgi:type I restriction enzyme S subunit